MNKKSAILNPILAQAVASAGHFDEIVIADCGLPIPALVPIIDVSVLRGLPSFESVFCLLMSEMKVESIVVAREIESANPAVLKVIDSHAAASNTGASRVTIDMISHHEFKGRTGRAKCIVRTGENTPYANVILVAGVAF